MELESRLILDPIYCSLKAAVLTNINVEKVFYFLWGRDRTFNWFILFCHIWPSFKALNQLQFSPNVSIILRNLPSWQWREKKHQFYVTKEEANFWRISLSLNASLKSSSAHINFHTFVALFSFKFTPYSFLFILQRNVA